MAELWGNIALLRVPCRAVPADPDASTHVPRAHSLSSGTGWPRGSAWTGAGAPGRPAGDGPREGCRPCRGKPGWCASARRRLGVSCAMLAACAKAPCAAGGRADHMVACDRARLQWRRMLGLGLGRAGPGAVIPRQGCTPYRRVSGTAPVSPAHRPKDGRSGAVPGNIKLGPGRKGGVPLPKQWHASRSVTQNVTCDVHARSPVLEPRAHGSRFVCARQAWHSAGRWGGSLRARGEPRNQSTIRNEKERKGVASPQTRSRQHNNPCLSLEALASRHHLPLGWRLAARAECTCSRETARRRYVLLRPVSAQRPSRPRAGTVCRQLLVLSHEAVHTPMPTEGHHSAERRKIS